MKAQSAESHAQYVPLFHFVLFSILFVVNILAIVNLYSAFQSGEDRLLAVLLFLIGIGLMIAFFMIRQFPIKVQDRAIRAEENLRHFVLTGKLLDKGLTMSQIIALRFADDEEFPALAQRALKENMDNKAIKGAIINWRADHHRA